MPIGFLDSVELKLALRVALGADLPLRECGKIIESVDADGNGTIDWPEFKVPGVLYPPPPPRPRPPSPMPSPPPGLDPEENRGGQVSLGVQAPRRGGLQGSRGRE